jgi:hypothetical protein
MVSPNNRENLRAQIQFPLRQEALKEVYEFRKNTYIYFEHGLGGILTKPIEAEKIKGQQLKGLQRYRSLSEIHVFLKHHKQKRVGTEFGAFADKAHKKVLSIK